MVPNPPSYPIIQPLTPWILSSIEIAWLCCWNESVGWGWGLRLCISNSLPSDVGPLMALPWVARLFQHFPNQDPRIPRDLWEAAKIKLHGVFSIPGVDQPNGLTKNGLQSILARLQVVCSLGVWFLGAASFFTVCSLTVHYPIWSAFFFPSNCFHQ